MGVVIKTPPLWKRRYDAFVEARQGSTALEFAMIALPFFFLIFGLIEIAIIFILSTTLDWGVGEAARKIRVGQLQSSSADLTAFKQTVCDNLFDLIDCDEKLRLDVQTFDSFTDVTSSLPVDDDGEIIENFQFSMGGADEIVMVRAYYEWTLITPIMSASLKNLSGNKRLLVSTAVFRNEPF